MHDHAAAGRVVGGQESGGDPDIVLPIQQNRDGPVLIVIHDACFRVIRRSR